MDGNYIGNNPNGMDLILSDNYQTNNPKLIASTACVNNAINQNKLIVDNKTTIEKNKKIVSKDIAINGDDTDLASERGIFNTVPKENIDYNTLVDQGVYAVANTGSTNGPGYAAKVLVYGVKGSAYITQIAVAVDRNTIKWRYKTETVTWTPWKKIILETDVATTSKLGIVKPNYGLNVKPDGTLDVDFNQMPEEQLKAIVLAMVQEGGGLAVDENGQLYVDFSTMPTDKFEALLKSIRVPIWLEAPLDIYVATTGSNTLDAGRGLSPDKPFATLGAALKYVSTTYNLYTYNVIIHIAEGDYGRAGITFPQYQTTSGVVVVTGPDQDNLDKVKIGRLNLEYASSYLVKDLTVIPNNSSAYQAATYCTQGVLRLQNVCIDVSETVVSEGATLHAIANDVAGKTQIGATDSLETKNGVIIKIAGEKISACLNCSSGMIQFAADITIQGDATMRNATVVVNSGGLIRRSLSSYVNPGRLPNVISTGTVTGVRYLARLNGVIDSAGGGAEFFPGTEDGQLRNGGQYI